MVSIPTILLKGGNLLAHEGTKVQVLKGYDLLIEGKEIRKIAKGITAPAGARVVDCANKIVSPGFIDTHHHLWQSQVRIKLLPSFVIFDLYSSTLGLSSNVHCLLQYYN